MTTQKLFKRRVRERMAKTGERYAAARHQIAQRREPIEASGSEPVDSDRPNLASAMELASDAKLHEATGRFWLEWISILDAWGARKHSHTEIAEFLRSEQAVPSWWTQAVTTGYERARGLRAKHQQADGFTVYASKTVGVSLDALFDAFVDDRTRAGWLEDGAMSVRNAQPGKVARFEWARRRIPRRGHLRVQGCGACHRARRALAPGGRGRGRGRQGRVARKVGQPEVIPGGVIASGDN